MQILPRLETHHKFRIHVNIYFDHVAKKNKQKNPQQQHTFKRRNQAVKDHSESESVLNGSLSQCSAGGEWWLGMMEA